jgi:acyl carrier protein
MTTLQTLQEILVREYGIASDLVQPEATLATLGLDSLSVIELMFKIEDSFGLKITEDTPANLMTVADVVAFIDRMIPTVTAAPAGSVA